MRIFSITAILAAVLFAVTGANDDGTSFWNILYGFAVMLAIFNILNLKVYWAAAFGAFGYAAIAYKMLTAPFVTGQVPPGTLQISGVIFASIYCLTLAMSGALKNRHPLDGLPETSNN